MNIETPMMQCTFYYVDKFSEDFPSLQKVFKNSIKKWGYLQKFIPREILGETQEVLHTKVIGR